MAHHLADLIIQARTLKGVKQQRATAAAADLVLKLWSKREVAPGNIYPLKNLGKALGVLRLLEFEASPFNRASRRDADVLLVETFDGLRKVVAHGIVFALSESDDSSGNDAKTPFLIDEEKRVIDAINMWIEHFQQARKARPAVIIVANEPSVGTNEAELAPQTEEAAAKHAFVSEIDELLATLSKLRKQIEASG